MTLAHLIHVLRTAQVSLGPEAVVTIDGRPIVATFLRIETLELMTDIPDYLREKQSPPKIRDVPIYSRGEFQDDPVILDNPHRPC